MPDLTRLSALIDRSEFVELTLNNVRAENPEQKEIKLTLIYTVTTPELKADVVREINQQIGDDIELLVYEAPEVFNAIKSEAYVSAASAAKMIKYYMSAVEDGADVILSIVKKALQEKGLIVE